MRFSHLFHSHPHLLRGCAALGEAGEDESSVVHDRACGKQQTVFLPYIFNNHGPESFLAREDEGSGKHRLHEKPTKNLVMSELLKILPRTVTGVNNTFGGKSLLYRSMRSQASW